MSRHVERAFEKTLEPHAERFSSELGRLFKKEDMVVVLSETPFLPAAQKIQHAECKLLTSDDLTARFNFEVKAPRFFPREGFSPIFLAGLVAYLNRTGDNYLNTLARDRVKWLTPENSA